MLARSAALLAVLTATACGGADPATGPDAHVPDAATIDGEPFPMLDAAIDGTGPAGFGVITGDCGVLTLADLDGTTPEWFSGHLDFGTNRYDDPAERDQLTAGSHQIFLDGNAGGSSLFSEVFAYEWLARCEHATLLKTETTITYDVAGKKADLLVEIDGRKVGVSVTRAVTFPFGQPYTMAAATTLFSRKLTDLQLATMEVSAADRWTKQMVVAQAYDLQHAEVAMQAWSALDATTRGSAIMIIAVTDGDDGFIYTNM